MDTVYLMFRRFLLVVLGVLLLGLVDGYGKHNWALNIATGVVLFSPLILWLARPKELKTDSLEESLTYALIPSVVTVPVGVLAISWLFHAKPYQYGAGLATLFAGFVVLGHATHILLRKTWVQKGHRPEWANLIVLALGAVLGLLVVLLRQSSLKGFTPASSDKSIFDDNVVTNPATGLIMQGGAGGFDAEGNAFGQSSSSSSGFDSDNDRM